MHVEFFLEYLYQQSMVVTISQVYAVSAQWLLLSQSIPSSISLKMKIYLLTFQIKTKKMCHVKCYTNSFL